MPSRYEEIDFSRLQTSSIENRESLVNIRDFRDPVTIDSDTADRILESFPPILAGIELRKLVGSLKNAIDKGKPRIWSMGAHSIKVGLSRHLTALMEAGYITHLATNGAGIIHDTEIACFGHTSEDVPGTIHSGKFAVTAETGEIINGAVKKAQDEGLGLGESIGAAITELKPQYLKSSLSAACYRLNIPFTVHLAIGTDVNHIHPSVDGAALGDSTHRDFRIFTKSISGLNGGVIVNLGSAVVLPVVIEKAIAVCQNLDYKIGGFDGYNLDFIKHYRSNLNPVCRAKESGGHGANIVGHHEITIPLLTMLLLAG